MRHSSSCGCRTCGLAVWIGVLLLVLVAPFAVAGPRADAAAGRQVAAVAGFGQLPLSFEENRGQTDPRVKFLSRGQGYTLFLTDRDAVFSLQRPGRAAANRAEVIRLRLLEAKQPASVTGADPLPGKTNYLLGNNAASWPTGVGTFQRVVYRGVYPGIDLIYYGTRGQLEYDFVVAPGADARSIHFAVQGADGVAVDSDGDLVLRAGGGEVRLHAPAVYQQTKGGKRQLAGRYALGRQGDVRFRLGDYDRSQTLFIDPVLTYSTYLGGSGGNAGWRVTVDAAGNAYVAGTTASSDFPTTRSLQSAPVGLPDVFVAKLNAAGTALVYSTYLGGRQADAARDLAVDSSGNAYVTGTTQSIDFPTTAGAFQAAAAPCFVSKLSAAGDALVYSTYLPVDETTGIAVDSAGNTYLTGSIVSAGLRATAGALQTGRGGASDAFVLKLNAAGSSLVYATYLGGDQSDFATSIAVDSAGNAFVAGQTASANFPVTNAFQSALGAGVLFKTANAGASWSPSSAGLSAPAVRSLAIDPNDASRLYAGTDQGLYRSTDGGEAWTRVGLMDRSITALAVDPADGSKVYAGTDAGVLRSSTYGLAWTATNLDPSIRVRTLVFSLWDRSTLYAGTDSGIYRSPDGGGTWVYLGCCSPVSAIAADYQYPLILYAGTLGSGLWRSTDGGQSWENLFAVLPAARVYALAIDPVYRAIVWTGTDSGPFVSSDVGATWNPSGSLSRPVYSLVLDPPSTIYAGTDSGVYKIDRTTSWTPVSSGLPSGPVNLLVISPAAPATLYASGTATGQDAFVAKLNAAGSALLYSTYLGGSSDDIAYAIAVDAGGSAYVAGKTTSADFPVTAGVVQPRCARASAGGACVDAFVAKLSATGMALAFSTYLGGSGDDAAYAIAADAAGNAYVTGYTQSSDFPAAQALQNGAGGGADAFVAKLNANASTLLYSTWLGGNGSDEGRGLGVDSAGSAYVTGTTYSQNFPTANPLFATNRAGAMGTAFVAKIVTAPLPSISSLQPASVPAGGPAFTLAVNGLGFSSGAVVRWNGLDRATVYVSPTQLQASILAGDIAALGAAAITVLSPPPVAALSAPATFTITAAVPLINAGGVLNGASFTSGLSGGMIASLFGSNFASSQQSAATVPLPMSLGGVSIRINGVAAPLFYVSPTQINFLVPFELLGQSQASLTVTAGGNTTAPQTVSLAAAAPGIFTVNSQGTGQGAVLIAPGGEVAAPANSISGRSSRPVRRGEYISVFCTGLGDVTSRPASGAAAPASPLSTTLAGPLATIGGVSAAVTFSGLAPGFAALYQVNVQVPDSAPSGNAVPLVLSISGAASNTVTIAIQ